jgi:hypothetical protein
LSCFLIFSVGIAVSDDSSAGLDVEDTVFDYPGP